MMQLRRVLCVAIGGAVVAFFSVGISGVALAKPMKPAQVMKYAFKKAAAYNRPGDQLPVKVTLTNDRLDIEGRCPAGPRMPHYRIWIDAPSYSRFITCEGDRSTRRYPSSKRGIYATRFKRIATTIAKRVGVGMEDLGEGRKLVATSHKATISFDPPRGATTNYVAKIVLRKKGRPVISTLRETPNESLEVLHNRSVDPFAINACLRRRVGRGPSGVSGVVAKNGRSVKIGASIYNDASTIPCKQDGQTLISSWIEMQIGKRFVRSSKSHPLVLRDEGAAFLNRRFDLKRPYTCKPGRQNRGIRLVMRFEGSYEGRTRVKTFRTGKIISPPSAEGFALAGKIKC